MMLPTERFATFWSELAKIPAFFRRDVLVNFSYRTAFLADWVGLIIQMVTFYYLAKIVNPDAIPSGDGSPQSYLEFVTVGITLSTFLQVGLGRVSASIRAEQLMGTLEVLLLSPTSPATLQLGVVAYDLVYVPIRTAVFLVGLGVVFRVDLHYAGLLPFTLILLVFIPFVWALGVASAASVVAFRRAGALGLAVVALTFTSGAYFPVSLLPGWLESLAEWNPVNIALDGARAAMIDGTGVGDALGVAARLLPLVAVTLVIGFGALHLALRHERRRGSLGLY